MSNWFPECGFKHDLSKAGSCHDCGAHWSDVRHWRISASAIKPRGVGWSTIIQDKFVEEGILVVPGEEAPGIGDS